MSNQSLMQRIKKVLLQPVKVKTSKKEWALFLRQLSHLLTAGIVIDESMNLLKNQKEFKNLKYYLPQVHDKILEGSSLYQAFQEIYKVDRFSLAMIKVGEETGQLDQVIYQLSEYFLQEDKLEKKVQRALIYPSVLLISMVLIIFFMTRFVFPNFISFFASYGADLPRMTLWMIKAFDILKYFLPIFICLLLLPVLVSKKSKNIKLKIWMDQWMLKLNPFKKLSKERLTQKICHGLFIIVDNGFPILEGLAILKDGQANSYIKTKMAHILDDLEKGRDLSLAFKSTGLFTDLAIVLLGSGEKTGKLSASLMDIHRIYELEIEETIEKNVAIFEPTIILILSVLVGFVVISLALPLFDVINTFNF